MKIQLDKNNRVIGYAIIGDLENSIEIQDIEINYPINDYIYEKEYNTIIYSPNIDKLKEIKRKELKRIRTKRVSSNIIVNGNEFQVREQDLENFFDIAMLVQRGKLKLTDKRNWILADNSIKKFTIDELLNVIDQRALRKSKIFNEYGLKSYYLTLAKNKKEIEEIEWRQKNE